MSGRSCHPFLHVNRRMTLVAKALVQVAGSFAAINHGSQMIFYLITGILAYIVMFFVDKRKPINN